MAPNIGKGKGKQDRGEQNKSQELAGVISLSKLASINIPIAYRDTCTIEGTHAYAVRRNPRAPHFASEDALFRGE